MNAEEKLAELREKGIPVYSFSRLSTFNNCQFEYFNTYIKGDRGIDNCYTLMGSIVHQGIENIYKNKSDINELNKRYKDKLIEIEMLGFDFPNELIKNSWVKDVDHFMNNFTKIDNKALLEKLIVFEVTPNKWIQGYIDCIMPSEKGKPYVNIIDWKTSSKFTGKKLTEAGRQLVMYKLGLEATSDFKVDKVMWFMIKYIYVCNMQKNDKVKKKMCNRGKWVKEIKTQLEKDLVKLNIDEFESELLLDKAIEDNTLDCMPKEIKDKYWLEDCFVEYEVTDEKINELKSYVVETVKEIESKNPNNIDEWEPIEIDKSNSFYCSVLCGHRKTCPAYKAFVEENKDSFDKKDKKNDLDDLF